MATAKPIGPGSAYLRCSSNAKKQDTERQRADIQAWLVREGLTIEKDKWFEDYGARDQAEFRADFQAMLNDARRRNIKWIVVQSLDRFGTKDAYELMHFIFELRLHGCQLWTSKDGKCISESDSQTMIANLFGGITSSVEQHEKSNRSQTTRVGLGAKGSYQGGVVPHGLDVVCTLNGVTQWRHVVTAEKNAGYVVDSKGHERIVPALPSHDRGTILQLAPSIKTERVETIKRIYKLFLDESISPGRIAKTLNDEGVDAVTSPRWTDPKIRMLIANPVYMGRPATGKRSNAKFLEVKNGVQVAVEKTDNYYAKQGRVQTRDNWIMPDAPIFEPIVSQEDWERAQEKLQHNKTSHAPRADKLYYAGLIKCGGCGMPQTGACFKGGRPSYICSSKNRSSIDPKFNIHGCMFNRVQHFQLDPIVDQFLEQQGINLQEMLDTRRDRTAFDNLLGQDKGQNLAIDGVVDKMKKFITRQTMELMGPQWKTFMVEELHLDKEPTDEEAAQAYLDAVVSTEAEVANKRADAVKNRLRSDFPTLPADAFEAMMNAMHPEMIRVGTAQNLRDIYEFVRGSRLEQVQESLQALRTEYERQYQLFKPLKPGSMAAERGAADLELLETQIEELKAESEPLAESFDALLDDLVALRERISEARLAFHKGSDRAKAECLRACIKEIRCFYEPHTKTRARLTAVEIVPRIGETIKFTGIATPAPGTSTFVKTCGA